MGAFGRSISCSAVQCFRAVKTALPNLDSPSCRGEPGTVGVLMLMDVEFTISS